MNQSNKDFIQSMYFLMYLMLCSWKICKFVLWFSRFLDHLDRLVCLIQIKVLGYVLPFNMSQWKKNHSKVFDVLLHHLCSFASNFYSQHCILSGYSLFLALVIDRLHNYVKEIRRLKKKLEAVSKENKTMLEEATHGKPEESKPDQKDIFDAKDN